MRRVCARDGIEAAHTRGHHSDVRGEGSARSGPVPVGSYTPRGRDARLDTMTTPLPFTWPYNLVYWTIHVWVFAPEILIVRRATRSAIPAEDRGSLRVVIGLGSVAMLAAFVLPFLVPGARLPGDRIAWFCVGVITLIAGSLLRRHCFRELGAFFTGAVTIQANHRVVDTGAYRWVRQWEQYEERQR